MQPHHTSSSIAQAIQTLEACGRQEDLVNWMRSQGQSDAAHRAASQINHLAYSTPTGLKNYLQRARGLLASSQRGENPFSHYKPEIPIGVFLKPGEEQMSMYEDQGLKELHKTGFVLIAGGLGERLGYSGIKLDLPVTVMEDNYCYLKYYAQYILAVKDRALPFVPDEYRAGFYVPLCIMTSDDTHERTVQLLSRNNYFGLNRHHVEIVKQENVPALVDNNAKIAFEPHTGKVITKPHGHGDIHNLLYDSGVAKKWLSMGKEWMVFIQDTNALALKAVPSVLGVSAEKGWLMNSVCVPRMPGEQMGAICKLVDERDPSQELVINVEYNQLDGLLRSKWNPDGDIKGPNGYSHFPGNTNTLVFKLPEYVENLDKTGGVIPEFVNPKYANFEKTVFKSPTRLECMMQDYPKLLSSSGQVGFTGYEAWYCFSPAKANVEASAAAFAKGMPTYGAAEAEYNFFNWTNRMLQLAGVELHPETMKQNFSGVHLAFGPKILMDPMFAITVKEIKCKFAGVNRISKDASMKLLDKECYFENLDLHTGTLVCHYGQKNLEEGIRYEPGTHPSDAEIYRIRGYKPRKV